LEKHADDIATLLCLENGKPKQDALMFDISFLIKIFQYFASLCDKMPSEFYDRGNMYCTVLYEPHGVCAGILPFNWPPIHRGGQLAPALAAGNTMVLKPGEQVPLTVIRIVEILQTVLPEDVVLVVPRLGPEVPQESVTNSAVRMVSFTGSTGAGSAVAKTASESLTPVVLELWGKNAFIVFHDADLDQAVRDALEGAFFNKGEACTASSRLLIQKDIYDVLCRSWRRVGRRSRLGMGWIRARTWDRRSRGRSRRGFWSILKWARKEGARVAAQAPLPEDEECKDGFFAPATLFADVTEDMRLFKEEMFGTVGKSYQPSTLPPTPDLHQSNIVILHRQSRPHPSKTAPTPSASPIPPTTASQPQSTPATLCKPTAPSAPCRREWCG
jgi:acyl-CoA reductase-like NAD-dependent aldehyde dehydrogenase